MKMAAAAAASATATQTSVSSSGAGAMPTLPSFSPTPLPPPPDSISASPSVASLAEAIARTRSIVQHARVTPQQLKQAKQQQQQEQQQLEEDHHVQQGNKQYSGIIYQQQDKEEDYYNDTDVRAPIVRFSGSTLFRQQTKGDEVNSLKSKGQVNYNVPHSNYNYNNNNTNTRLDDTEVRISKYLEEDMYDNNDGHKKKTYDNYHPQQSIKGGLRVGSGNSGNGARGGVQVQNRFVESSALYSTRDMENEIDAMDETMFIPPSSSNYSSKSSQGKSVTRRR
jgi:hypothetical protein